MASEINNFCFLSGIQKTPFEAMYRKKPNLESNKVFVCSAFVHVEKGFRGRIDRTFQKGLFWGLQKIVRFILWVFHMTKGSSRLENLGMNFSTKTKCSLKLTK